MAEAAPLVLLGGASALKLALRLEASGYRTAPLIVEEEAKGAPRPSALLLSPSLEAWIPVLRQRFGSVPILLGCEDDTVESRCLVLGGGADDLWLTSAGPSDLLTRLRLHLHLQSTPQAPSPGEEVPIVVGDLLVDPHRRTAERNGHRLELTAREFQLLLLLSRQSPEVVERKWILMAIWPEERAAASNLIEVYVRYLRRKLEAGNRSRLIHTVRGVGYCLRG